MEWSDVEMERRDTTSGVENEMESHFLFRPRISIYVVAWLRG